jgi:hypothetical protein
MASLVKSQASLLNGQVGAWLHGACLDDLFTCFVSLMHGSLVMGHLGKGQLGTGLAW